MLNMTVLVRNIGLAIAIGSAATTATALCQGFGPQTPRDISNGFGRNMTQFETAPPAAELNLCNIHTHTNAEHMGPGFRVYAGPGDHGGFRCSGSNNLTAEELTRPGQPIADSSHGAETGHAPSHSNSHDSGGHGTTGGAKGTFKGVEPGDTIEVHWVYTSCDVDPGPGLGSCMSGGCANPQLRVESQVFLVVNDPNALDFMDFAYRSTMRNGLHQPRALPTGTGNPIVFRGSTTGPSFTQETCSPLQVTWSVRPRCARLNIATLDAWAAQGNVFEEDHSHGVRQLVTAPELLAPID